MLVDITLMVVALCLFIPWVLIVFWGLFDRDNFHDVIENPVLYKIKINKLSKIYHWSFIPLTALIVLLGLGYFARTSNGYIPWYEEIFSAIIILFLMTTFLVTLVGGYEYLFARKKDLALMFIKALKEDQLIIEEFEKRFDVLDNDLKDAIEDSQQRYNHLMEWYKYFGKD